MKVVEEFPGARLTHEFEEMTPEKRPQDPHRNRRALKFETLEHGGKYPDTMPQALRVSDREGRSCIFEPAEELGPEERPQDRSLGGESLTFEVLEYGGDYDDDMPMSIRLTDHPERRSCIYVPITVEGRLVDSKRFTLERLDARPRSTHRRRTGR